MDDVTIGIFEEKIRNYFEKLLLLTTQVPFNLRPFLLFHYMLFQGFKSEISIDPQGKIGFELIRSATRPRIKVNRINVAIELQIFGVLGTDNKSMFTVGFNTEIWGGDLTNELSPDAGFVHVPIGSTVKIIDCRINWISKRNTKVVKHFPFVWIIGDEKYIIELDPGQEATYDFYNKLFGKLRSILTETPRKFEKNIESKIEKFYYELLTKIKEESKSLFTVTQGDEQIFQEFLDRYKFFLSPYAKNISSQPIISGAITKKADYCIQLDDNKLIYVEIEPPYYKPFIGQNMSNRLDTALNQVKDWKSIIERKQDIKNHEYLVIIGLDDKMTDSERELLNTFNKSQSDTKVVTWDYFHDNIVKVMNELRNMST